MVDGQSTTDVILEAMAARRTLGILYHGGSNPGSYREILPLQVTQGGSLRAKCMTSNAVKFFKIESIELAPSPPV